MPLDPARFDGLSLSDIQLLIDAGDREGVGLEYKAQLNVSNDEQKKEFLADISSLANAKGGFVLFGVEEERDAEGRPTGVPHKIIGVESASIDSDLLRIENIARDGIEPRIVGLRFRPITVTSGRELILAYVPLSLSGPHIVKYKGASRFFSRNSVGKYPLAYSEIRDAFLRADERIQRVRSFRMERIAKLVAGEGMVSLGGNPLIVVHLLPLVDATVGAVAAKAENVNPIYSRGWNTKLNFEGALSYSELPTYVQIFRNGAIEAVAAHLIRKESETIPSFTYEDEIRQAVPRFLSAQIRLGVQFPVAFCFSLIGVKGKRLAVPQNYWEGPPPIPRNDLIIGETLLEAPGDLKLALKMAFDLVWQASGWEASINFEANGDWKPK